MDEFKPTNRKPLGMGGKNLEKSFDSKLNKDGINLTEIDAQLNEKQQSFKKQHWNLAKMESLVFSDPILSSQYDGMSERGEEKYGYHYNETIMNMLFNKYVTNDVGYQQKYLNAIPEKKERRDKSGISQLQQKGEEKMNKKASSQKSEGEIHNNSLEGVIEEVGMDNNLNTDGGGTFDDRPYLDHRIEKNNHITPNTMEESIVGPSKAEMIDVILNNTSGYEEQYLIDYSDEQIKEIYDSIASQALGVDETTASPSSGQRSQAFDYNPAKNNVYEGEDKNRKHGVVPTSSIDGRNTWSVWINNVLFKSFTDEKEANDKFNELNKDNVSEGEKKGKIMRFDPRPRNKNGTLFTKMSREQYIKSIGYPSVDHYNTKYDAWRKEYDNQENEQLDETTKGSVGAFEGPFHKKGKDHITNKPAWHGGKIVANESYLVNGDFFKEMYNKLNESMDSFSRVPMAEFDVRNEKDVLQNNLKKAYADLNALLKTMNTNPSHKKAYETIKQSAQNITQQLGVEFKDPEKKPGVFGKIKRGLGFGEGELHEHHAETREEKIQYILKMGKNKFGDAEMLNSPHMGDEVIDRLYQQVEKDQIAINPMGEAELNTPQLNTPMLRESIGSLKSIKDFKEKYNLKSTGKNGGFHINDFEPILTNPIDKDDQYDLAMLFANNLLSSYMMDWDDLGDINSLWDVVENGHRDIKSFLTHTRELANERLSDIDGGMFEGENVIKEDYLNTNTREDKIGYIKDAIYTMYGASSHPDFDKLSDEHIDKLFKNYKEKIKYSGRVTHNTYNDGGEGKVNEKAVSRDQQELMGQVYATQKGELENPSAKVEKIAKQMKPTDVKDFASTKHKGLPEKVPVDEGTDGFEGVVEYHSEKSDEEPFELGDGTKWQEVWAIYPNGSRDVGYYRFGHDLVYSWDYFNNNILKGKNPSNEGMISGTDDSIISDNPTSISNTMKDVPAPSMGGDMGGFDGMVEQGSKFNIDSHGRKDDVKFDNENSLDDYGRSHGGLSGFNKFSDNYYDSYKKPEATGAPQNKDLSKYNKMTEGKEHVCENCGSPLDEDGHCRRDEFPVVGKSQSEEGSCKKKNNKGDSKHDRDNKYNLEFRKKREKEYDKKVKNKPSKMDKELSKHKEHMKKLKEMVEGTDTLAEEKRPSALVQLDRLQKDNAKNFKSDVKNSNSAELAADQDELTAGEQIEEVPDNAYELAEKIEKDKMKEHEFNSFDNDGNSTNDTNKDIPKRNATDEEADDIMLNRGLGMQDIVYDNKPDERFDKRMKKDMGETIYDQRQEKMKFRSKAPMYAKDTQPTDDGTKETQYDKNISKFNNPKGIKENHIVASKFVNEMNKTVFINFNVNEAPVILKPEGTKLVLEGMGNTYTQGVNENVEMRKLMDSYDFYINGGKVTKVAKGKQTLTEGEEKKPINEQLEKMKKLWNYKPEGHLSTSNVKKNRGF